MNKYYLIFKNTLHEHLSYRLNFILWRLRILISLLITFFLWQSIYRVQNRVFGYNESQILTYIVLMIFVASVTQSTQTFKIAYEINFGRLANILSQPINYFGLNIARDLSDKLLNTIFSFFELGFILWVFKVPFIYQTDFYILSLFFISIILSTLLFFQINVLLSLIGFWSRETWSARFLFLTLLSFLSGMYFPLDILPGIIFNILKYLPFPYLVFFPLKIYLGSYDLNFISFGISVSISWIIIFYFLINVIWKNGLKVFTAEGY